MTRNNRRLGADKEALAASYLESRGVSILERNFRCRQGEIDLVAREGEYLVFAEVKYRGTGEKGYALEAVGPAKQAKICRVADYYRAVHGYGDNTSVRYDVVGIQGEDRTLSHINTGECDDKHKKKRLKIEQPEKGSFGKSV